MNALVVASALIILALIEALHEEDENIAMSIDEESTLSIDVNSNMKTNATKMPRIRTNTTGSPIGEFEHFYINNFLFGDEAAMGSKIFNEDVKNFPFAVYIRTHLTYMRINCAGSIVTKLHILTAAKCLYDTLNDDWAKSDQIDIVAASTYPFKRDSHLFLVHVIYPNHGYIYGDGIDAAVIELQRELTFSSCLTTVELVGPHYRSFVHQLIKNQTELLVLGWGGEKEKEITNIRMEQSFRHPLPIDSMRLLSHFTRLSPLPICSKNIEAFSPQVMLCARRNKVRMVTLCPGTRGGPLLLGRKQFGIVSSGTCFGRNRRYYTFTRIDTLRGFIDRSFYVSGRYKDESGSDRQTASTVLATLLYLMSTYCQY